MTAEQRLEIEGILNTVFDGFTDERLQGTYYSIASMSEEEQVELVTFQQKKMFFHRYSLLINYKMAVLFFFKKSTKHF
jgi:hypothetical protein